MNAAEIKKINRERFVAAQRKLNYLRTAAVQEMVSIDLERDRDMKKKS